MSYTSTRESITLPLLSTILLSIILFSCNTTKTLQTKSAIKESCTYITAIDTTRKVITSKNSIIDTTSATIMDKITTVEEFKGDSTSTLLKKTTVTERTVRNSKGLTISQIDSTIIAEGKSVSDSTIKRDNKTVVETSKKVTSSISSYLMYLWIFLAFVAVILVKKYLPLIRTFLNL